MDGVTEVVLAAGADAGITGLRPTALRHTHATRRGCPDGRPPP
ncbi:hypothetical protein [Spongiactinospora sp. TRM90649]|nr:hypothetical protein [Spongiactinospora sp. TRM90649]MDF5753356.1 hypothetical protein [Spongiactinospora sp. TRM90649]